jgi:hypothetical protein
VKFEAVTLIYEKERNEIRSGVVAASNKMGVHQSNECLVHLALFYYNCAIVTYNFANFLKKNLADLKKIVIHPEDYQSLFNEFEADMLNAIKFYGLVSNKKLGNGANPLLAEHKMYAKTTKKELDDKKVAFWRTIPGLSALMDKKDQENNPPTMNPLILSSVLTRLKSNMPLVTVEIKESKSSVAEIKSSTASEEIESEWVISPEVRANDSRLKRIKESFHPTSHEDRGLYKITMPDKSIQYFYWEPEISFGDSVSLRLNEPKKLAHRNRVWKEIGIPPSGALVRCQGQAIWLGSLAISADRIARIRDVSNFPHIKENLCIFANDYKWYKSRLSPLKDVWWDNKINSWVVFQNQTKSSAENMREVRRKIAEEKYAVSCAAASQAMVNYVLTLFAPAPSPNTIDSKLQISNETNRRHDI